MSHCDHEDVINFYILDISILTTVGWHMSETGTVSI